MNFFRSLAAKAKAIRIVRFLLVGGINAVFAYAVYAFFLMLGLGYALASFMSLIDGNLFSFKTHGTFVFNNTANGLFFRYAIFWFLMYLCNLALVRQMLIFGLDAYTAGALAMPPVVLISYLVQKYFIFNIKNRPAPDL